MTSIRRCLCLRQWVFCQRALESDQNYLDKWRKVTMKNVSLVPTMSKSKKETAAEFRTRERKYIYISKRKRPINLLTTFWYIDATLALSRVPVCFALTTWASTPCSRAWSSSNPSNLLSLSVSCNLRKSLPSSGIGNKKSISGWRSELQGTAVVFHWFLKLLCSLA